jgi:hypothetical protein
MDQLEATGRLPMVEPPPRRPSRRRIVRMLALAALALVVVIALWAVDTKVSEDKVGRRVTLGGQSIAGMDARELEAAVADLAVRYHEAGVVVEAPDGGFEATAPELGLSVDQAETAADAMAVGRTGNVAARIFGWGKAFLVDRPAPVRIDVDQTAMERIVRERDPKRSPPVEPSIMVKDDKVVPKPGEPGRGISAPSVLAGLRQAGPRGLPLRISVDRDSVPPRFPIEDARRLADRAEALSAGGLPVTAGPATATVPASVVRGWFRTQATEEELKLTVDASDAPDALAELFPEPAVEPVDAGFTVNAGKVSITPAKAGSGCCGPGAAGAIQAAREDRPTADPAVAQPL